MKFTNIEKYLLQNIPENSPHPSTNATPGYTTDTFQQDWTILQAQNTSNQPIPKLPSLGPERKAWDHQADKFALGASRLGKTIQQISKDLVNSGYKASLDEVVTNLSRLGVKSLGWESLPVKPWDADADVLAMAAHNSGKTISQITYQLNTTGYAIFKFDVVQSLTKQGVKHVECEAEVPSPLSWDDRADAAALAGYRAGKAASTRLHSRGDDDSSVEVTASADRQGAIRDFWIMVPDAGIR